MAEETIWLVGGSNMAEPMCKEIKRRGYKLFLSDADSRCHCHEIADNVIGVSVYDVEENLRIARRLNRDLFNVAAVLTIGTDAGPTVSALSDFFGLPGIGRNKAEMVKDKIRMRQALGLPAPYFFAFRRDTTDLGFFSPDKFPMVVKPPDQAGSRGLAIAKDNESLHKIVGNSKGDLIFEEMLDGKDLIPQWRDQYGLDTSEAAFDFFIEGDKITYANGALRLFWADQPGIEAGHINPFEQIATVDDMGQILNLAIEAAHRLSLTWGVLKIDVKKDVRYGWCLLECATRLSGGFDHCYTSGIATGRDVTGIMLDVALGGGTDQSKLDIQKRIFACAYAPRYEPGLIDGWVWRGNRSQIEIEAKIFQMTQKRIKPLKSNQDRPLFIITSADTANEAMQKANRITCFIEPVKKVASD